MTERLYHADSWLAEFTARVVGHGAVGGRASATLDRTAFFPEGGGQMADHGELGGAAVVDVQVDDGGVVHHVVDGVLPAIGADVTGLIDRARRRVHMALHTGQHMLSRALVDEAGAATLSARLGESGCTIDVDRAGIAEADLMRAIDLCNSVVDDDVAIRAYFPEPGQLAALPLRREPKVDNDVRVIAIGDYDVSPCGGTHCTRTGQVGLVHVTSIERYKGGSRVWFVAGPRARRELGSHSAWLRELGRGMSCGPDGVADAVGNLRRELAAARQELKELRERGAEQAADRMIAQARAAGRRAIVAALPGASVDEVRAIARRVTAEPDLVCLLSAESADGAHVLCARGADAALHCGQFLSAAAHDLGGRGGGRADHAEGRFPCNVDWASRLAL